MGVPGGEPLVGQHLGEDPVLGRAEEGALQAHEPENHQRSQCRAGGCVEGECRAAHEQDFRQLHGNDDGSLADPVGQEAGRERADHEGNGQDAEGDGGLELGRRLIFGTSGCQVGRRRLDRQESDDQFPGVVVEGPEELGDQQELETGLCVLCHGSGGGTFLSPILRFANLEDATRSGDSVP